jgi:hypothetical protein
MLAMIVFGWGAVLFAYPSIFNGEEYIIFRSLLSARWWSALLLANGFVCLVALIINGSRKEITPWLRMLTAVMRAFTWAGFFLAHSFAGLPGPWIVLYSTFFFFEWVNLVAAARDTGESYATKNPGHIQFTG